MGHDLVELVVTVESSFGVSIPDHEAAKLDTVGKLYDYLKSKTNAATATACATGMAFYELRRVLVREFGLDRRELVPAVALETIFQRPTRRERWKQLAGALKYPLRGLEPTPRLIALVSVLAAAAGIYGALAFGLGLGVVCGLAGVLLFSSSSRPWWASFPGKVTTLGELASTYARDNYAATMAAHGWNDRQAWNMLKDIVVEQLDVKPEQVTRDARFVEDLGAD